MIGLKHDQKSWKSSQRYKTSWSPWLCDSIAREKMSNEFIFGQIYIYRSLLPTHACQTDWGTSIRQAQSIYTFVQSCLKEFNAALLPSSPLFCHSTAFFTSSYINTACKGRSSRIKRGSGSYYLLQYRIDHLRHSLFFEFLFIELLWIKKLLLEGLLSTWCSELF